MHRRIHSRCVVTLAGMLLMVVSSGCAMLTVPAGGAGTVTILQDGFVETIAFEGGPKLNIQINDEEVPEGEALFPHELTIGKFSPVIGSGFTKRENIYYRERIDHHGSDTFEVDGETFRVRWESECWHVVTTSDASVFRVTIEHPDYVPALEK